MDQKLQIDNRNEIKNHAMFSITVCVRVKTAVMKAGTSHKQTGTLIVSLQISHFSPFNLFNLLLYSML